jgi:hypothetical protein|tara:strand:- start:18 stop:704 length:687 start_codon:yes stop_codon:yes gene_type:complete
MIGSLTNLFPVSIYQVKGGISEKLRQEMVKDIDLSIEEAGPTRSTGTWTGDCNGYHAIHNSAVYKPVFDVFSIAVREYITSLGCNPEMYTYYYTRSWGVRQTVGKELPPHTHAVSHLSGVYYPKAPEGSGNFVVSNPDPANQLFTGMYEEEYYVDGTLDPTNPLCAQEASFKVSEDLLLLFPSKTMHKTLPNTSEEARYSITTDILFILKDASKKEAGMNPIHEWKKA